MNSNWTKAVWTNYGLCEVLGDLNAVEAFRILRNLLKSEPWSGGGVLRRLLELIYMDAGQCGKV